jgi:hypothetical protein
VPPPPPPPGGGATAPAGPNPALAGPVERIDQEWGTPRGGPASKPAPERAGKPLDGDHFAYTDDRRPLAYRGAWKVGEPDISPGKLPSENRSSGAFFPKGSGKYAALVMLMMAAGGFFFMKLIGDELLAPVLGAPGGAEETVAKTPIILRSHPSGATVTIDGKAVPGQTPMLHEMELTPGDHEAVFSLDGDEAVRKKFTVAEGDSNVVLSEALKSSGVVKVTTRPAGAKLYLDGDEVGSGSMELPKVSYAKEHVLEAKKDGYASAEVKIPSDRPLVYEVELTLSREGPKGRVVVMTHPASELMVDGQTVGGSGPGTLDLPIGGHVLSLAVPGLGVERKYQIEVPDSGVGRYYFDLTTGAQ